MSQLKLSELTGIRYESISNLNRGKNERISLDHLTRVMTALEITDVNEILHFVGGEPYEDPLDDPIEVLDLSPRAFNAIKRLPLDNIVTVRDLLNLDLSNRSRFRTAKIGAVTIKEIKEALEHYVKKHK